MNDAWRTERTIGRALGAGLVVAVLVGGCEPERSCEDTASCPVDPEDTTQVQPGTESDVDAGADDTPSRHGSDAEELEEVPFFGPAIARGVVDGGAACEQSAQCASGYCVDGVCCDLACEGACERCDLEGAYGTCTLDSACAESACGSGALDAGACAASRASGDVCTVDAECVSSHCVDGVCCESACDGVCRACDVEGSLGVCTLVDNDDACGPTCPDDTDCRHYASAGEGNCAAGECRTLDCSTQDAPAGQECGDGSGQCSGFGECGVPDKLSLGEICAADSDCAEQHCVDVAGVKRCCRSACDGVCEACDAEGDCDQVPDSEQRCPLVQCPAPSACVSYPQPSVQAQCFGFGQCLQTENYCEAEFAAPGSFCGSGLECNAMGQCVSVLPQAGEACSVGRDCASGFCVDGVCCDGACNGQCQTCTAPGSAGLCVTVTGVPVAGRQACSGSGVCKGVCDGVSPVCVYPGAETECRAASCSNTTAEAIDAAFCDGGGSCPVLKTDACGDYACDGLVCRDDCAGDSDCLHGVSCVNGDCVKPVKQILMASSTIGSGGGSSAIDQICQAEFGGAGSTWKALLVGGGRRATITPYAGDGQIDWVIDPYTEYFNWAGQRVWTTDDVALLGVQGNARVALSAPLWDASTFCYPWSGYADDWTIITDETCGGWTSNSVNDDGAIATADGRYGATEPCDRSMCVLCVEQ